MQQEDIQNIITNRHKNRKESNRNLTHKWDIKISLEPDIFTETFSFLREIAYNTIWKFSKEGIEIYTLDIYRRYATYIVINKTEMIEYKCEEETITYADIDITEELLLNPEYPVDIYFETLNEKMMYIVNSNEIIGRRLINMSTEDDTIETCNTYKIKMKNWITDKNTTKITAKGTELKETFKRLDKIIEHNYKLHSYEQEHKTVNINFSNSEIEWTVSNNIQSTSILISGKNILVKEPKHITMKFDIESIIKFGKLRLHDSDIIFYVNTNLPLVIENIFNTGNIHTYYMLAPKIDLHNKI